MSQQPLVSIITPTYNCAKYTDDCIRSVIGQDYKNWEMFVVDDGSRDNTAEVVHTYTQEFPNIHYHRIAENTGSPVEPRNIALSQAHGRYVAFLDGDDIWLPAKLSKQMDFMQQKDCAVSFTGMRTLLPDGVKTGNYVGVPESIDFRGYLKNTCITFSSSMVDTEKTGPIRMDEKAPHAREDAALWIKLFQENHKACGLNEELMYFRRGHDSFSSNVVKMAMGSWELYRDYAIGLTLPERVWCFANYAKNAVAKRFAYKSI